MANAGDLYLGDMSGFGRQLDWRHKIIEEDKRSRIEAADQIRNDVLQLGQTVSTTIRQVGAPEWMGGRKMDELPVNATAAQRAEHERYKGLGSGENVAKYEEMKYKVQDKERDYKIRHNQQVITAGMHNIKMAKAYDLNARWYGQDPVALEKSWSKRHDDILQDMDAHFAYQKADKYPSFYSEADRNRLKDLKEASYRSDEQRQTALENFRATPSVFSMWAKDNGLVNSKFVGTYPQATVALRKRMVDMGYLDAEMFADTKGGGLYAGYGTGTSTSNKRVIKALKHVVDLEDIIEPEDTTPTVISTGDRYGAPDSISIIGDTTAVTPAIDTGGIHQMNPEDIKTAVRRGEKIGGKTLKEWERDSKETYNWIMNFFKKKTPAQIQAQKQRKFLSDAEAVKTEAAARLLEKEKGSRWTDKSKYAVDAKAVAEEMLELTGDSTATEVGTDTTPFHQKTALVQGDETGGGNAYTQAITEGRRRISNLIVKREGGYEAAGSGKGGMLYDDLNDIAFPGGFNAGDWSYGKSEGEKIALSKRLAQDDDGNPRPEMERLILDLLNTQGREGDTPAQARGARRYKYSMVNENGLRGKIKISKRGMLAGVDFASRYNLGQLVKTRPWLKDSNAPGYILNPKFPEKFRDMLADITYRFGGGAFKNSKSLWTPTKDKIDFDSTLKEIVEAKTYADRKVALERFKKLFKQTNIHLDEGHTDRIKAIIKSIDDLKREWT